MHSRHFVAMVAILLFLILPVQAFCQSAQGTADIRFEFDIAKLKQSKLIQEIGMENLTGPAASQAPPEISGAIQHVIRVWGAASLPENVEAAMAASADQLLPMDFYLCADFDSTEEFAKMFDSLTENDGVVLDDETKLYMPTDPSAPTNMGFRKLNDHSMIFGSVGYVNEKDLDSLFSPEAKESWQKLKPAALRLVLDATNNAELMEQIQAQSEDVAPNEALGFVTLIEKLKTICVAVDLANDELVDMRISGRDAEATESLHTGIEALLGIAAMGGQMQLGPMKEAEPEAHAVISDLLKQLKSKKDGDTVTLSIKKPAKFDEVLLQSMAKAKDAAMSTMDANRFKQIGLAVYMYHDTNSTFPTETTTGQGKHSWRSKILPYLELSDIYEEIDPTEDWNSTKNKKVGAEKPAILCNKDGVCDACFIVPKNPPKSLKDITDGTSNTAMILQNPKGVQWNEPVDLTVEEAVALVTSLQDGESLWCCYYDGSVRKLDNQMDADTLRSIFEPGDGK